MKQNWHDLLFAHWPVAPGELRPLVPKELDLDLFAGNPYVAVAPFHMSGICARWMFPFPGLSCMPELHVRTYVRHRGVPGVYFFSLDAASMTAVRAARAFYGLPYKHARMSVGLSGEIVDYSMQRIDPPGPAEFRGRYWPISPAQPRVPGTLEHFLTERYCLYTVRNGRVSRGYIHHLPWPLQNADAEIETNSMARAAGIELPAIKPILHFSKFLEVLIWWPEKA